MLDNSSSMQDEAAALALADLPTALGGAQWRLDVTTTSVLSGDTPQPGDGGRSVLGGASLSSVDADPGFAYRAAILCQATCFDSNDLPRDAAFVCDPTVVPGTISVEYLDCVCGVGTWEGHCGSGNEMGLEAGELMLCRATASAPEACSTYESTSGGGSTATPFDPADAGSVDLLQGADDVSVLILSDEGDGSYRQAQGDADASLYVGLYGAFGAAVSVVGPWYEDEAGDCLDGAQTWSVERYQGVASATGGAYLPITDGPEADCAASDMSAVIAGFVAGL